MIVRERFSDNIVLISERMLDLPPPGMNPPRESSGDVRIMLVEASVMPNTVTTSCGHAGEWWWVSTSMNMPSV